MNSGFSLVDILDGKAFAFNTGRSFRGLSITERGGVFNIVLRSFSRSGEAEYAMHTAEDPLEGLQDLWEAVSMGAGEQLWRKDKFFSKGGA